MNSRMKVNNKGYIIGITTIGGMGMLCPSLNGAAINMTTLLY